jgi:endo-1,4-beta-xylanase
MQNRREFLAKLGGAALSLSACKTMQSKNTIAGEEWRNKHDNSKYASGNYWFTKELKQVTHQAIAKNRKGTLKLKIKDKFENPLGGYRIQLKLLQHNFDWGFSGARDICNLEERDQVVTPLVRDLFNCTTAKCYWDERWHQPIESKEGKRITKRFRGEIDWGLANGLQVKGHPLVWTVRKAIPEWMDKYPYPRQMKILEDHVRDLIRVGHGVTMWDLCNEMLWEPSLRNLPERDWPHLENIDEILTYLQPAVEWAKDENPHATYVLNDYGLTKTTAPGVTSAQQRKRFVKLINEMRSRGCLPDAIGSQAHVAGWYTANEFTTMLNELSESGLPLQITEFWAKPKDNPFKSEMNAEEQQQALIDHVSMIYALTFAHPNVSHISYWGSNEWFDKQGNAKPLYQAIYKLIKEEWTTAASIKSDSNGEIQLPAFFGTYGLSIQDLQGNTHYEKVLFKKHDTTKTIVI